MNSITCIRSKYDPMKSEEDFLKERKQGIGASDAHHLLNVGPYACPRRLHLEKIECITPTISSHHIERGKAFEEIVSDLYEKRSGNIVAKTGTAYIREMPFIRANADRVQFKPGSQDMGVLEIKCPAEHAFKAIKENGLPQTYIAQVQQQMLCYGTTWGTVAVFWADGFELLIFPVLRDAEMIKRIIYKQLDFQKNQADVRWSDDRKWSYALDCHFAPPRDECDDVCAKCPAVARCWPNRVFSNPHSFQFAPSGDLLCQKYLEAKEEIKKMEKVASQAKRELEEHFRFMDVPQDAGRITSQTGRYSVTRRSQTRESIDQEKLKEDLTEELLAKYMKQTTFEVVTIRKLKAGEKDE